MMSLLSMHNVNVSIHDTPILKNLNIDVNAGEVLGVIGESGSGKSMMALAIMGLLPSGATLEGDVRFGELALNELDEAARCDVCGNGGRYTKAVWPTS